MPRGDGTGPAGWGPMTGRGAGYCAGYATPGFVNAGLRRRMGMGMGFRGGRGNRWVTPAFAAYPTFQEMPPSVPTVEQNVQQLKDQAQHLAAVLEQVQNQISALEGKSEKEE